jgi:membrane-associated phospholipid phosphatase
MNLLNDISWVVPLRNDLLTPIFQFFTWLGYPTFMMLILPLGYWLWGKDKFTRVTIVVIVSTIINTFLKDLWENPRPDLVFRLDGQVGKSFGMPSGHAQVSAALWFWVAYEIGKTWAWAIAAVVVTGICFSRIYLGIHDLEDILAGLGIAAISLFLFRFLFDPKFKLLSEARWS